MLGSNNVRAVECEWGGGEQQRLGQDLTGLTDTLNRLHYPLPVITGTAVALPVTGPKLDECGAFGGNFAKKSDNSTNG